MKSLIQWVKKFEGSFYEKELQKAKQTTFRIEKVLRRDNKKKKAVVKWIGYSDKLNSWVSFKDLVNTIICIKK